MNKTSQLVPAILAFSVSLCFCGSLFADEPKTKTLLLLGQKPDGHPPATHEYMPGQRILAHLLRDVPGWKVEVVQADGAWPEGPELLSKADAVVLFVSHGGYWIQDDPRRFEALVRLAERGGGIAGLHWGLGVKDAKRIAGFAKLLGACHGGPDRKFKFFEEIDPTTAAEHAVTRGVEIPKLREEYYFALKREPTASDALVPLITIPVEGDDGMVSWAWQRPDGGRSFGFTGLHFHENWRQESYRRLIAQGVLWTMKVEPPAGGLDLSVPETLLKLE